MIKNLLFDLGGVFLDLDKEEAINRFRKMGVPHIENYINEYEQAGAFNDIEQGKITVQEFCDEMSRLCGRSLTFEEVQHSWFGFIKGMQVEKLDYVLELKKHYRVVLISNTNPFVNSWTQSKQFSKRGLPLSYYFEEMFLSYQCGYTKPDERFFHLVEHRTGIDPEETLFIDDGVKNLEVGKNLGYQSFHVANGEDWRERMSQKLLKAESEKTIDK